MFNTIFQLGLSHTNSHSLCPFVDELVLLGNHRDAWVFGAADASSGTAAMVELSRVIGEQLKKGTVQLNAEGRAGLLK